MARYDDRGRSARFWGQPRPMRGAGAADYRYMARYGEEHGYGFRRGYDRMGGFGPSGERARSHPAREGGYGVQRWRQAGGRGHPGGRYGREMPAWAGDLRVGRRYGHGYGRA